MQAALYVDTTELYEKVQHMTEGLATGAARKKLAM